MPYLNYLYCEKCGENSSLDLDFVGTVSAYKEEGRKSAFINQKTIIWDYLVYTCWKCNSKYKYTYRDVERRVREYFCTLSEKHKEHFEELGRKWKSEEEQLKIQEKSNEANPKPDPAIRVRDRYTHKNK